MRGNKVQLDYATEYVLFKITKHSPDKTNIIIWGIIKLIWDWLKWVVSL